MQEPIALKCVYRGQVYPLPLEDTRLANDTTTQRIDALQTLHTSLIFTRNGYEEAIDQAKAGNHTQLFRDMASLHTASAADLALQLTALGVAADTSGSFMSTVHRTVIDVRSFITGLGDSVVPSLISGEERILGYYDDAIKASGSGFPEYPLLVSQRDALRMKVAEMERMKARAAA